MFFVEKTQNYLSIFQITPLPSKNRGTGCFCDVSSAFIKKFQIADSENFRLTNFVIYTEFIRKEKAKR